ncbi:MAG: hypothetical protein SCARUB_04125 [Candidatus Scalindua rubra]|uniref:Uncharacterized protein n=1 Tax=Candidatus Scalindua rubra TaxID=1872076 RepID=A0A1E3X505_9BACT|nr:MAG: hypothetical protein SCARUB_04125 [Candidatus Scalindua rubra]
MKDDGRGTKDEKIVHLPDPEGEVVLHPSFTRIHSIC